MRSSYVNVMARLVSSQSRAGTGLNFGSHGLTGGRVAPSRRGELAGSVRGSSRLEHDLLERSSIRRNYASVEGEDSTKLG
jgi:hypothetical protein